MRRLEGRAGVKVPVVVDIPGKLTRDALDYLMQELKEAEEDLEVGSVILAFPESGDRFELKNLRRLFPELAGLQGEMLKQESLSEWNRRVEYVRNLCIPVVAAVDGHCSGWSFELALAADMIVCSEDAEFSIRDCPNGIPIQVAVACGLQRTKRLSLFGETLAGAAAVEWGLGNFTVSGSSIELACEVAMQVALPPRDGMSVLKESLNAIDEYRSGAAAPNVT